MKIKFKREKLTLDERLISDIVEQIILEGAESNVSQKVETARDIINSDMDTLVSKESIKLLKSFCRYSEVVKDYILNAMYRLYKESNFNDQIRMAKSHDFLHDHLEEKNVELKRFEGEKFGRMSGNYTDVTFIDCDFSEADVTGANFNGSHFEGGTLMGITGHDKANFWGSSMKGVKVDGDFSSEKSKNFDESSLEGYEEEVEEIHKHTQKKWKDQESWESFFN